MQRACFIGRIGHKYHDQAFTISDDIGPIEPAVRLAAALFAERQQPAEPRIGGPVHRIDKNGHAIGKIEAAADDQTHTRCLGGFMGANDPGKAVAVGDRQRLDAEPGCLVKQLLARTRPAQKTKMRGALQLGIARGSSENPVQEPMVRACRGVLAIA